MTLQSPRIYTYKITFEEVPYYYYGMHEEKVYDEEYWGSPQTHKWCWELYTPKKQILETFSSREDAGKVEKRLIKPVYDTDKWCLNENCGGILSLDSCSKGGKIGGEKLKELGIGVFGRTKEQIMKDSRKGGKKAKELGLGVHGRTKEQMAEDGKKGGKITGEKNKELGIGFFSMTEEEKQKARSKGGKIAGNKNKELGIGIHAITPEQKSQTSKKAANKTNSQKWMCTETGFVTNPGNLTKYQRARDIDTSKRKRIK